MGVAAQLKGVQQLVVSFRIVCASRRWKKKETRVEKKKKYWHHFSYGLCAIASGNLHQFFYSYLNYLFLKRWRDDLVFDAKKRTSSRELKELKKSWNIISSSLVDMLRYKVDACIVNKSPSRTFLSICKWSKRHQKWFRRTGQHQFRFNVWRVHRQSSNRNYI